MIYLFLIEGYEEIEAVTVIDILRRAGLAVHMVSVMGNRLVKGSHGITMMADSVFRKSLLENCDMMVLPGGLPGATNLAAHEGLKSILKKQHELGKGLAAICAAPSVLGQCGILQGRSATCYPGFEDQLTGAKYIHDAPVVIDGHIITGNGPGAAMDFALAIVERFCGPAQVQALRKALNSQR